MNFVETILALKNGCAVARVAWARTVWDRVEPDKWLRYVAPTPFSPEHLQLRDAEYFMAPYTASMDDMLATDWVVTHTVPKNETATEVAKQHANSSASCDFVSIHLPDNHRDYVHIPYGDMVENGGMVENQSLSRPPFEVRSSDLPHLSPLMESLFLHVPEYCEPKEAARLVNEALEILLGHRTS